MHVVVVLLAIGACGLFVLSVIVSRLVASPLGGGGDPAGGGGGAGGAARAGAAGSVGAGTGTAGVAPDSAAMCPICLEQPALNPLCTNCGHTLCGHCFVQLFQRCATVCARVCAERSVLPPPPADLLSRSVVCTLVHIVCPSPSFPVSLPLSVSLCACARARALCACARVCVCVRVAHAKVGTLCTTPVPGVPARRVHDAGQQAPSPGWAARENSRVQSAIRRIAAHVDGAGAGHAAAGAGSVPCRRGPRRGNAALHPSTRGVLRAGRSPVRTHAERDTHTHTHTHTLHTHEHACAHLTP